MSPGVCSLPHIEKENVHRTAPSQGSETGPKINIPLRGSVPLLSAMVHPRGAIYLDDILKGSKSSDRAEEWATKLEHVINRRTVKALRLSIPQNLLLRADDVTK